MDLNDIPREPPPRLTIKEVVAISGLSTATISKLKTEGRFPKPIYRCKYGQVFNGKQVYDALGYSTKNVDTESEGFNVF